MYLKKAGICFLVSVLEISALFSSLGTKIVFSAEAETEIADSEIFREEHIAKENDGTADGDAEAEEKTPLAVPAEEKTEYVSAEVVNTDTKKKVITGFKTSAGLDLVSRFCYREDEKPSLEHLQQVFPYKLEVYLEENKTETVSVDVSWYCVGEDYEKTRSSYYLFSCSFLDSQKFSCS